VEAARMLAENVIKAEANKTKQIIRAHRLLTGLSPKTEILDLLNDLEKREKKKFELQPNQVSQLMKIGEYAADQSLNLVEVAAMTLVCSTIMSFDETLVKR
jgi:hypothetical protein